MHSFLSHLSYYHDPRFDMVWHGKNISRAWWDNLSWRAVLGVIRLYIIYIDRFFEFYCSMSVLNLCDPWPGEGLALRFNIRFYIVLFGRPSCLYDVYARGSTPCVLPSYCLRGFVRMCFCCNIFVFFE